MQMEIKQFWTNGNELTSPRVIDTVMEVETYMLPITIKGKFKNFVILCMWICLDLKESK